MKLFRPCVKLFSFSCSWLIKQRITCKFFEMQKRTVEPNFRFFKERPRDKTIGCQIHQTHDRRFWAKAGHFLLYSLTSFYSFSSNLKRKSQKWKATRRLRSKFLISTSSLFTNQIAKYKSKIHQNTSKINPSTIASTPATKPMPTQQYKT